MAECFDETSSTQRNLDLLGTTALSPPIVSDRGSFTLQAIDKFASDFEKSFVYTESSDNPINLLVEAYGEIAFYESVRDVNAILFSADGRSVFNRLTGISGTGTGGTGGTGTGGTGGTGTGGTGVSDSLYPNLTDRLKGGIILTPIEIAQFTTDFAYTPPSLSNAVQINQTGVLSQLEAYYTNSFTQSTIGAFCALAPSIFAAIGGFFSALDNIKDFIKKIQDFSLSGLISKLKSQVTKVFDKIVSKIKGIVENFSIANIVGQAEAYINERVITKAKQLKDKALAFFSKENLDAIKKRIEGLVEYAINLFKNPTIDEIQFLIYRFCGLAAQVEAAINQIKNPLTDYAAQYDSIYRRLAASSNQNTAMAIRAGALRYDTQVRKQGINGSRDTHVAAGNPAPIEAGEVEGVTSWNNGNGDSRIGFQGRWVSRVGEEGWTGVKPEVRVKLMRIQSKFGRRLIVNSGYRPPWYNEELRKQGIPAARDSYHVKREALDITWSGYPSDRAEFINIAKSEGFRGIINYNRSGFTHIDVRPAPGLERTGN
jgi:hypothetical protein